GEQREEAGAHLQHLLRARRGLARGVHLVLHQGAVSRAKRSAAPHRGDAARARLRWEPRGRDDRHLLEGDRLVTRILCVAALLAPSGCAVFHADCPARACSASADCFTAQGEVCNTATRTCEAGPDAGPGGDAGPTPDAEPAADAEPTADAE